MKLAIVGPHCPLAEQFIAYLKEKEILWDLSFFHLSERSPLLEFMGKEYPVLPLNKEEVEAATFDAYLFFPQEDYRELMLSLESRGCKVLDCTGTFVNEPTVPLVLPPINHQLVHKHNLICLPGAATALIVPILCAVDHRFKIKRVSVATHERKKSSQVFFDNEYSDEEINAINEAAKILDNDSIRYTISHLDENNSEWEDFFFNLEFSRPFNVDDLLLQLLSCANVYGKRDATKEKLDRELILRRYRRDLSLDSGIHMWISTQDTLRPLFRGIHTLLGEIQTG